jgi:hypothetical protein
MTISCEKVYSGTGD